MDLKKFKDVLTIGETVAVEFKRCGNGTGNDTCDIHIPPSSEVHTCKKVIYDRIGDTDVKVTATGQIAAMYIRKQKIFTEKKIYPYVKDEHLRLDMLPRIRQMAQNRYKNHPWRNMTDVQLLHSAALIGEDLETGENDNGKCRMVWSELEDFEVEV